MKVYEAQRTITAYFVVPDNFDESKIATHAREAVKDEIEWNELDDDSATVTTREVAALSEIPFEHHGKVPFCDDFEYDMTLRDILKSRASTVAGFSTP